MEESATLIVRILVGGLLGGLVGLERELRSKEAGFRTHFLVSLGSALLTVVSAYGYDSFFRDSTELFRAAGLEGALSFDPSRIAAQIVSGIGFLGAGIIIFQKNAVHGLTTAAGLWVTSAIGIACGVGHYDYAVAATIMVLCVLEAMVVLNPYIGTKTLTVSFTTIDRSRISEVMKRLEADGIRASMSQLKIKHTESGPQYNADIELHVKVKGYEKRILEVLEDINGLIVAEKVEM